MRLSLCEAPTLKEQHKGQPQHRETSRPKMSFYVTVTIESTHVGTHEDIPVFV